MKYRLHPDAPVTWIGESRLRIGGVVRAVTVRDSQLTHDLISELRRGATPEFLASIAAAHPDRTAVDDGIVADLLSVSDPAPPRRSRRARVLVRTPASAEAFGRTVAGEFARHGHAAMLASADYLPDEDPALVVDIAERVHTPRRYLPLLAADLPHLLIARDLDGLVIGPLVLPGVTPCLRCDDLQRSRDDANWLATATQLANLAPPQPPRELEWAATLLAVAGTLPLLAGVTDPEQSGLCGGREVISAQRRQWRTVTAQPECGCQAPQESGMRGAARRQMTVAAGLALG